MDERCVPTSHFLKYEFETETEVPRPATNSLIHYFHVFTLIYRILENGEKYVAGIFSQGVSFVPTTAKNPNISDKNQLPSNKEKIFFTA